jgi:hypothetical protein
MKKRHSRIETEASINFRAWKEPDFKKQLIAHPKETLKSMGLENIPNSVKIKVIEEQEGEWCIVLKKLPHQLEKANPEELSKEDLEQLAAGFCFPCV